MTYCTPYLLQLGLTKSKLSLVWIAGPLSGLIMQPIVGILADKSTSKWGRRRPVMMGGTVLVSMCLLVLGWTGEIVDMFVADDTLVRLPFFQPPPSLQLTRCRNAKQPSRSLSSPSTLSTLP